MKRVLNNPWLYIATALLLLPFGCTGEEKTLQIGDRAPDFTVVDLQGQQHSLQNWKGYPVILRFWETDCKYCRVDTPIFNQYYSRFKDRGLKIIYVSTGNESADAVEAFARELAIDFPVVVDSNGQLASLYRVKVAPQTIFIAPDQSLIAAVLGGVGEAEFSELLGQYLQQ